MDTNLNLLAAELPTATTNVWRIRNTLDDLLSLLIKPTFEHLHISYLKKSLPKLSGESKDKYYARVHSTGKNLIRRLLGLSNDTTVQYEMIKIKEEFFFFYVSALPVESDQTLAKLLAEVVEKRLLIQGLLSLHLKLEILAQAVKEFEIGPIHHNSSLYISAETYVGKNLKRVLIDAFEIRLYFSDFGEIVTTLRSCSFAGNSSEFLQLPLEDTTLFFNHQGQSYKSLEAIDARTYSRKKYIRFQSKYPGCQNHAHVLVSRYLRELLSRLKLDAEPVFFKASVVRHNFFKVPQKKLTKKLVVIDNYDDFHSSEVRSACYTQIREVFPGCDIVESSQIHSYGNLSEDTNYLILNRSVKNNGSSIVDNREEKVFNSFWQAMEWSERNENAELDLYSRFKIENFKRGQLLVLQGLDLAPGLGRSKNFIINPHVLTTVASELWLKERVLREKRIVGISADSSSYQLVYIRRPEGRFYACVVGCNISNDTFTLNQVMTFNNEDELRFHCPQLVVLTKLYDRSFYIYDLHKRVLLCAYTSARVPQIIGNVAFDNINRYYEDGGSLRKLSAAEKNPLPYYVSPKIQGQYHHIFVQPDGMDLRYFVSPKGNPRSEFDTQQRVYNLLTWGSDGSLVTPLAQGVTTLFFDTFTDDIQRNNQVSKTSLLMKVTKMFLEN